MRGFWQRRGVAFAAAALVSFVGVGAASGQPEATSPPNELLQDFIHYVRIDQYLVAADRGQDLLRQGMTELEFLALVEDAVELQNFQNAIAKARRPATSPDVRRIADELDRMYEAGRRARARDPREVERNIGLLTQGIRARSLARERLIFAGEYAVPQLMSAYLQRDDVTLQAAARDVLVGTGRHAIMPLVAALPDLDSARQESVVGLLGQVQYTTWIPFVLDLREATTSEPVRAACNRAVAGRLGGTQVTGDVASWFLELSERFYAEKSEVTSFPGEEHQLVWDYNPGVSGSGLVATPIRTEVFHEAMSMRLSERSLRHRANDNPAMALWLAANFSREIDTPAGYQNPLYGADRREAMYFAVGAGVDRCQWVLARALDTRDTPLARRAIEAIDRVAGDSALRMNILIGQGESVEDRQPLLEALRYPNRRVQYEAALALAKAQPRSAFDGAERVVPLLTGALRDASSRVAIVVGTERERVDTLRTHMERLGYRVLAGQSIDDVRVGMADSPGIDVVLMDVPADQVTARLEGIRAEPSLYATPVLAMADGEDFERVRRRLEGDPTVALRPTGLADAEMTNAVSAIIDQASGGPITPDEARMYADRSLTALRDLAVAGNAVFDVADGAQGLIASLQDTSGGMRLRIAEVLSYINQDRVQVAMMETAMSGSGIERVEMMGHVAASAKRHGNLLEDRQIGRLVDLTLTARGPEATAAAALMGSLNLPNDRILPLILSGTQAWGSTTASR